MGKLKPKSLRRGLIILLVALQAITVVAVLFLSRINTESVLLDQAKTILHNAAKELIEHTHGFVKPAYRATQTAADVFTNQVISVADRASVERYFLSLLQNNREVSGIFVSTVEGEFTFVSRNSEVENASYRSKFIHRDNGERTVLLQWRNIAFDPIARREDPQDSYNPLSRPWYKSAYNDNDVIWTDPYIFFTSKKPGITVAVPYYDKGVIAGIVGTDIELTEISEFMSRLRVGDGGSAFIVNPDETLVALSTPDLVTDGDSESTLNSMRKVGEIDNDVVRRAFAEFNARRSDDKVREIEAVLDVNGVTYVAVFLPLELPRNSRWVVGVQVPKSSFLKSIQENQNRNLLLGLAVLLFSVIIGWALMSHTSKPVDALQVQAINDHLTGLFNRRHLAAVAGQVFTRLRGQQLPLSIAMIDIDRFKTVNDSYGHGVGDEILIAFSRRLKGRLRESDVVARFGGEEFVVLMPETDLLEATSMLDRMRESIADDAFRTSIGLIEITVSIGVTEMNANDSDWSSMLERADQRLYEAKVGGRDQVAA